MAKDVRFDDELNAVMGRSWPDHTFHRHAILRTGSSSSISTQSNVLDISCLTRNTSNERIARQLADHISRSFLRANLESRSTECAAGGGGAEVHEIWAAPYNEISVLIDIIVTDDQPTAEIRTVLIDAQQLRLW